MGEKIIYPKEFDSYFKEKEILIKQIPDKYRIVKQDALPDKRIKNTKTLYDYLKKESEFWNYPEVIRNYFVREYKDHYVRAYADLNAAIKLYTTNPSQALTNFKKLINYVVTNCVFSSNTQLAKFMKKFKDKNEYFFYGFNHALIPTTSPSNYNYQGWHEGCFLGMEYIKAIKSIEEYVQLNHSTYSEAVVIAEKEISDLVEKYTSLYHSQEQKINELWSKNEEVLKTQKNEIDEYFASKQNQLDKYLSDKEQKLLNLEATYEEKLKLSKPAEYWQNLSKNYSRNGNIWLFVSIIIALITIVGLVLFIIFTPSLFDNDGDLYLILKNTALLTVVTSIAIYILRITIKMAMSSYHLARDSKEREQLAYFYLSLMQTMVLLIKKRQLF